MRNDERVQQNTCAFASAQRHWQVRGEV